MKVIHVEPKRCTGCKSCEIVCSLYHEGEVNPAKSRISVMSWEKEGIDIPVLCQQCEDPPCQDACPTHALYREKATGAMLINEEACIGCRMCILACPFGAPSVRGETGEVIKCDLCGGDPQCVRFCEPKAIQYMERAKISLSKKRETAKMYEELLKGAGSR